MRILLLLVSLAAGGCGPTAFDLDMERIKQNGANDAARIQQQERYVRQLERVADALDRAHPVEGGGK